MLWLQSVSAVLRSVHVPFWFARNFLPTSCHLISETQEQIVVHVATQEAYKTVYMTTEESSVGKGTKWTSNWQDHGHVSPGCKSPPSHTTSQVTPHWDPFHCKSFTTDAQAILLCLLDETIPMQSYLPSGNNHCSASIVGITTCHGKAQ